MRDYRAKNVNEFCEHVYKTYKYEKERYNNSEDFEGVNIVAHYDVLIDIVNALVKRTEFNIAGAIINDVVYDGYANEFIISIDNRGDMYVEPVYVEEKDIYLYTGSGLTFVHNDCNSKYVTTNSDAPMVAFEIGAKEDADNKNECAKHECKKDCDIKFDMDRDDMKGFTQTYNNDNGYMSRSFYTDCDDLLKFVLDKWT